MKTKLKIATPIIDHTPVIDPPGVAEDPTNKRVLDLFDAFRRRGVGPEKAAYAVSQVFSRGGGEGCFPAPTQNRIL